ncbi:MAG: DUF411 domain-containing protein [Pseudomonadota bacterium]
MLRHRIFGLCAALALVPAAQAEHADEGHETLAASETIMVYKSPACGCCKKWIQHLEAAGFEVEAIDSDDMNAVKQEFGVPRNMTSCHTARVAGYTIEGHVPADDILRLLGKRPEGDGLAVPGMPVGSPGMEMGDRLDPYKVMLFGDDGATTWASYGEDIEVSEAEVEPESDAAESG